MEIAADFSPETYGWAEINQTVSAAGTPETGVKKINSMVGSYRRGTDVVTICWTSPTNITTYSKNGMRGELTLNAFMRTIK